jgi:hypothetical protein
MRKTILSTSVAILFSSGCSKPHGIYPVSGRVTYKGEPAAGALVFFHRQDADPAREQTMMAVVGNDGSFSLDCGALGKGAPPGQYIVLLRWKSDPSRPSPRSPTEAATLPDRLGGRYADPRHPLLHAVVRAETNILPPFELSE